MNAAGLAAAVVARLAELGVEQVVIAPGSRNAPLGFALRASGMGLHSRIDERTGAFLALGMAKASGRPVAVVTTSGTAVANLHPAMLEAAHSGVPLIAVTADRPARLRGTIANQTTDQVGVFAAAAATVDVAAPADLADLPDQGPVHLNVQFDEPLVEPSVEGSVGVPAPAAQPLAEWDLAELDLDSATVVVAGDGAGPGAVALAEAAGWPLLAEPTSGARYGPNALRSYRLLLDDAADVEQVVALGRPTLSRPVQRLLQRLPVIAGPVPGMAHQRPHQVVGQISLGDGRAPIEGRSGEWLGRWQAADRARSEQVDEYLSAQPFSGWQVAAEVARAAAADGSLVVGASNPIRDLDLVGAVWDGPRRVYANRGLAGIDGTLSTALGVGLANGGRTICYLGDVTFLHDLTGLVIGPEEQRPDLTIVVANDNGGSIFATLEQGAAEYDEHYEKLFGTPHGVDLAGLCSALRVAHWRVSDRDELAHALAHPNGGIEVVEAAISRQNRREMDQAIRSLR